MQRGESTGKDKNQGDWFIGLLVFGNFFDLIRDLPATYLGYKESEKDYLKRSIYDIYTPEDEEKYGVLGIRIELVG